MIRMLFGVLAAIVLLVPVPPAQQRCKAVPEQRLDQETYVALTDWVYAYSPDIDSQGSSGGWKPFTLRVLIGQYRRPFLLPRSFMTESDLNKLLAGRPDITQSRIAVPGYDARKGTQPPAIPPLTIRDGSTGAAMTVRVLRVVPVSKGVDHVFVDAVCAGR